MAEIAAAGGRIEARGDRLRLTAQKPLPPDLVARVREAKPELLDLVQATWCEADDDKTAITEYDPNIREWAEGFARLDPNYPPANVPPRRWQQLIDDGIRFLDSGFSQKAVALAWDVLDLFGCDRHRPFDRIDQQGLCWLIAGNRLVDLSDDRAIIETWTGARQTWRRKPGSPGRVLPWELIP